MKFILLLLKSSLAVIAVLVILSGCAGHKKRKCADCPKWSKAETSQSNTKES